MPFVQVPCFIYTSPLLLSPSTVCFERSILRTSVSWIGAVKSRLLYCAPVSTIAAQLKYHRIMAGGCGHKSGQNAISSKRFAGTLCVTGFAQKLLLLLRWLLCMHWHCIEWHTDSIESYTYHHWGGLGSARRARRTKSKGP